MKYKIWKSIALNSKDVFGEMKSIVWNRKNEMKNINISLWNCAGWIASVSKDRDEI